MMVEARNTVRYRKVSFELRGADSEAGKAGKQLNILLVRRARGLVGSSLVTSCSPMSHADLEFLGISRPDVLSPHFSCRYVHNSQMIQ